MKRISWGWRIVFAYIIFIAGTASWVAYAVSRDVDLVRSDYYEQGLKVDQTMAAQGRARALQSSASITFDAGGEMFVIQIPPTQVASAAGTVTLYRPNASAEDQVLQLRLRSDGTMLIPASQLSRGIWEVTVDWCCAGKTYQLLATRTI